MDQFSGGQRMSDWIMESMAPLGERRTIRYSRDWGDQMDRCRAECVCATKMGH